MTTSLTDWDVIIAGAGPGGTASAIKLAEAGVRVLVIESEEFPRFRIGESLLPAAAIIQTELGLEPQPGDGAFLRKRGARFLCEETQREQRFDFAEALPGPQRYAWHVDRAQFDTRLRDRARAVGAEVRHGHRIDAVNFNDCDVTVQSGGQTQSARYFIDATGSGRFLAKKFRSAAPYRRFGKSAVYTHFTELNAAAIDELGDDNDVRIVALAIGWAWIIPLPGARLSVGLVSREKGLSKSHLDQWLAASPLLTKLTGNTQRLSTQQVGNFSFKNTRSYGPRFACVGDAACFVDPVFSSGVSLAVRGGVKVSAALVPALQAGREDAPDLMDNVATHLDRGYDTFAALVYRFYNTQFTDRMLFGAPNAGEYRAGVISVLAGDVFRTDNPFQEMLLSARRHPFRETGPLETEHREGV